MKIININLKKLLKYLQLGLELEMVAENAMDGIFETTESDDKVEKDQVILLTSQIKHLRILLWTCMNEDARVLIIEKLGQEKLSAPESVISTLDVYIAKIHLNRMFNKSLDEGETLIKDFVDSTTVNLKKVFAELKDQLKF